MASRQRTRLLLGERVTTDFKRHQQSCCCCGTPVAASMEDVLEEEHLSVFKAGPHAGLQGAPAEQPAQRPGRGGHVCPSTGPGGLIEAPSTLLDASC